MSGRVNLFNGCKFIVESTNREYHTYDNWGLYITNTNCIGEPKQYTNYVEIPGRNGRLDMSEALTGQPVFISRQLTINLAGANDKILWDPIMSRIRNFIHGKVCKIIFDNDPNFYWKGRVSVVDFESAMTLGNFTIKVEAEPYKYSVNTSTEPWLWDPFNFETDMITFVGAWTINGTRTVSVPAGHMPITPDLVVSDLVGDSITVAYNGNSYSLYTGSNVIPEILVGGESAVSLTFTGNGKVQCVYRGGSL